MQATPSIRVASLTLALALAAAAVRADTVHLTNGDIVRGDILELDDDELVVDADKLDDVNIDIDDIAWVETSRPFLVQYTDGTEIRGYVAYVDGRMLVRPPPDSSGGRPVRRRADPQRALDFAEVADFDPAEAWISYEAELDVGINGASGNTDQASFAVSGELAPTFGPYTLRLNGQLNHVRTNDVETAANWRFQGAFEREINYRWSVVGLNRYECDRFQDLDLRITAAAGPFARLLRKRPSLEIFLGPAFVNEAFYSEDDRTFAAALWSLDFEYDFPKPDITPYHNHNLVIGLSDRQTIVQTTTGLKLELVDDLDLKLEYQFDWNNKPTDDAEAIDQRYLVKISYELEGDENDWFR